MDSAVCSVPSTTDDDHGRSRSDKSHAINSDNAWDMIGDWPGIRHTPSELEYSMDGRPPSRMSLRPRLHLRDESDHVPELQSTYYSREDTTGRRKKKIAKNLKRHSVDTNYIPIDSTRIVAKKPFVAGSIRIKRAPTGTAPLSRSSAGNNSSDAFLSKLIHQHHHQREYVSTSSAPTLFKRRSRKASPVSAHISATKNEHHDSYNAANQTAGLDSYANASSASFIKELSATVLSATKNLEHVSRKLRDVTDSLSTSMDLNISMQKELNSTPMMKNSNDNNDSFQGHRSHHEASGLKASARDRAGSPIVRYSGTGANPTMVSGQWDSDHAVSTEAAILDLIKSRMGQKLRHILSS